MIKDKGKYRSDEEVYFSWWLNDCIAAELISSYQYESETFKLSDRAFYFYNKIGKRKTTKARGILLGTREYTFDFTIHFTDKAFGLLTTGPDKKKHLYSDNNMSRVEIKGKYDKNDPGHQKFGWKQAWLFASRNIYVQKVIIANKKKCFFERTFTPSRYFFTDGGKQGRKLNYEARSVEEFIKNA